MKLDCETGAAGLKKLLKENPEYRVYDFSQLEAFDQCARKYSYRYRDNLATHGGVEAAFSTHIIHPAMSDMLSMGVKWGEHSTSANYWTNKWKKFTATSPSWTSTRQELAYRLDHAKGVLSSYFQMYHRDSETFAFVDSEVLCWKPLPDVKNAIWIAKPDLILERRTDGALTTGEIKCSSWAFARDLNSMDRQILSQTWTTGSRLQLKIFLGILVSQGRERMTVSYNPVREIKPPDEMMLSEWIEETQTTVEMIQLAERKGVWPKRAPRSCNDFNRKCEFIELCQLGTGRKILQEAWEVSNSLEYLGLD